MENMDCGSKTAGHDDGNHGHGQGLQYQGLNPADAFAKQNQKRHLSICFLIGEQNVKTSTTITMHLNCMLNGAIAWWGRGRNMNSFIKGGSTEQQKVIYEFELMGEHCTPDIPMILFHV